MDNDMLEFAVGLRFETEKAYKVFDGQKEIWLPKSQVEFVGSKGNIVEVPKWLAEKTGLL